MPTVGMYFSISSFIILFILSVVFFGKERVNNNETKLYGIILIVTLMGLFLEIFTCIWYIYSPNLDSVFYKFFSKLTSSYYMVWSSLFVMYLLNVCNVDKKLYNYFLIVYCLCFVLIMVLPVSYNVSGYSVLPSGPTIYLTYTMCLINAMIDVFFSIKYGKKIVASKFTPVFALLFLGGIAIIISIFYPALFLIGYVYSLIALIMYFTIENPDMKMVKQLELAKEAADKANHAKTDFLSSMSHEIRTPLNAIVGFSDCIMEAKDLNEAQENAKDIVNASQTLLEIVNGILDISKIEAGKIEIVNSPYDAHETFEELAKLITPKMNEKGLDFSYTIAPDLPKTLYGDHANLKKVVTNLLSNACKYTEHGYVHYEVNCINTKTLSKLIISVEDSGRGIKKDSIDKLFTKFQRLDEDRNTTIEGTGLGLAITKQLVELMGGKIIVHTVYGEGSKFTVVLNQRIEATEEKHEHHVQTTLDLYNIRILIVDDTALNLKVACKLLQRYNANQLVTCDSGFECIDRIKRGEVYDLILLDDMMPKMSGVETLQELKKIPGFRIPTVALTANAITGMKEKYLKDGFDGYLAKPIEKEQLIQVINEILGRNVTQELDFSKEEKVTQYIGGPVSPSIRGEEIPNVDDYEKAEEARKKNEIIPVEDNIEEVLGDQLELNYQEKEEASSEEKLESQPQEILPVVDIDLPTETIEKVYDRKYLEDNGVDVNHALELLGDMDMYNMTISDFFSEVEDKWSKIVEYKETNNMPEYAILVHSLKSDCKYLGFMTLADISYQHELKSKENDEEFVNSHFSELEEEYKKVLEIARTYVEHNPVENQE